MIFTKELLFSTQGFADIIDITQDLNDMLKLSKVKEGLLTVHAPGSTAGITTIEFEPGLVEDLKAALEKLAPSDGQYAHDKAWGDGNGFSHIRAALIGSSRSFPVNDAALMLGTWQQVVLIDFDNKPRKRKLVVQVMGN